MSNATNAAGAASRRPCARASASLIDISRVFAMRTPGSSFTARRTSAVVTTIVGSDREGRPRPKSVSTPWTIGIVVVRTLIRNPQVSASQSGRSRRAHAPLGGDRPVDDSRTPRQSVSRRRHLVRRIAGDVRPWARSFCAPRVSGRPVGSHFIASERREQRQLGLALAAEHVQVDLDAADPARLGERDRLRLEPLRGEDAAAAPTSPGRGGSARGSGTSCSTASIVATRLTSTATHPSSPSRHMRSTGPMSVGHSRRTSRSPSPSASGARRQLAPGAGARPRPSRAPQPRPSRG